MRKAKPFAQPMSPLYIARHANRSMLDVTAISLDGYLSDWAGIAECPGSRKQYHGEVSLADVLRSALNEPGSKPLYTNFDEAFLASNSEEFAELRRHMLDLRAMCGLDGWANGRGRVRTVSEASTSHSGAVLQVGGRGLLRVRLARPALPLGHALPRRSDGQPLHAGARPAHLDADRPALLAVHAAAARLAVHRLDEPLHQLERADALARAAPSARPSL